MPITNEEKLADAEAKLHSLLVGTSPRVIVDQNGERVEYTAANRASLQAYVESLKAKTTGATRINRRPLGAFF